MTINNDLRPLGRRHGVGHGALRATVLQTIRTEDPTNPITDLAIAVGEGVSESAISEARRTLGLPVARLRASAYSRGNLMLGPGLAGCAECMMHYTVPPGKGVVDCPMGHGLLTLSTYRLLFK